MCYNDAIFWVLWCRHQKSQKVPKDPLFFIFFCGVFSIPKSNLVSQRLAYSVDLNERRSRMCPDEENSHAFFADCQSGWLWSSITSEDDFFSDFFSTSMCVWSSRCRQILFFRKNISIWYLNMCYNDAILGVLWCRHQKSQKVPKDPLFFIFFCGVFSILKSNLVSQRLAYPVDLNERRSRMCLGWRKIARFFRWLSIRLTLIVDNFGGWFVSDFFPHQHVRVVE